MKERNNDIEESVLDELTLGLLGSHLKPEPALSAEKVLTIRTNLMQQIDMIESQSNAQLVTIRSDEGDWQLLAPKIYKKVLSFDKMSGVESYLLRLEAGAQAPAHDHPHDELCLVLEGDVQFDDVYLKQGDYHFAPQGSSHGTATSQTGALIFLQAKIAA